VRSMFYGTFVLLVAFFKIQGCFLHSRIDFMLPLAVTPIDRDDEIQECL
jgi:hypothetical protein